MAFWGFDWRSRKEAKALELHEHKRGWMAEGDEPRAVAGDSMFLASVMSMRGDDSDLAVPWDVRSSEMGAKRFSAEKGVALWHSAWIGHGPQQRFSQMQMELMAPFFDFVSVRPGRELIQQGEYGSFMLIQLSGAIAVERTPAEGGDPIRFAQTQVGDLIGEMSLIDGGVRYSSCTTLVQSELAVLTLQGLDAMLAEQPRLAAHLVVLMARKLSVRLRVISSRLED